MTGQEKNVAWIQGETLNLSELGTSHGRVRCLAPRQVERMKASLVAHGQLMAMVVVKRQDRQEPINGFKRQRAAEQTHTHMASALYVALILFNPHQHPLDFFWPLTHTGRKSQYPHRFPGRL